MLLEMRLRALGVIDDAVLELGPGLTVVTGETGAGKTMVVTGLGLLLGGRADPGAVRDGQRTAPSSRAGCSSTRPAASRRGRRRPARELDDGDVLLVSRTVSAEGAAGAHLGGRSVPVGRAGRAGRATWWRCTASPTSCASLARRASGRRSTGSPAPTSPTLLAEYRGRVAAAAARRGPARARSCARARERAQEAELLRLGLAEVEAVAPAAGRGRRAARRGRAAGPRRRAAGGRRAGARCAAAGDARRRGGAADVAALVAPARRALDPVARARPRAGRARRRGSARSGTCWPTSPPSCASYAAGVEADPARLAAVQERRAALAALTRDLRRRRRRRAGLGRAGVAPGCSSWTTTRTASAELRAERDAAARAAARGRAPSRSRARTPAGRARRGGRRRARRAGDAARRGSRSRAPARRRRRARASTWPSGRVGSPLGPDGVDEVELLLAPHAGRAGAAARPGRLRRRAVPGDARPRGGARPAPTRCRRSSSTRSTPASAGAAARRDRPPAGPAGAHPQVLVVTHLPQVAAYADRHLVVVKADDGDGDRQRRAARSTTTGGCASWPGCSPAWRTPAPRGRTPGSCSRPRAADVGASCPDADGGRARAVACGTHRHDDRMRPLLRRAAPRAGGSGRRRPRPGRPRGRRT